MKIAVSSKNEFKVIPDIADNLELPEGEQFVVVMRKLSQLQSGEWSTVNADNEVNVDIKKKLAMAIVRLENAPTIDIDGVEQTELTKDILIDSTYPELYGLQMLLISEVYKSESDGSIDVKKS